MRCDICTKYTCVNSLQMTKRKRPQNRSFQKIETAAIGIEPIFSGSEPDVLPINYAALSTQHTGVEPVQPKGWKP